MDSKTKKILLKFQKNEITGHFIYQNLSNKEKGENKQTLKHISNDELKHYHIWKKYTKTEVRPSKYNIWKYTLISRIAGLTFAFKLMEKGEENAQYVYSKIISKIPEAKKILSEEDKHERELIALIDEEKLNYIGSIILGLNDALVELTGTIAGLTFALLNTSLVGIAALITGIAASLSMASSEYLSKKSENERNALKASVYTGIAYVFTVAALVFPYFIFKNPFMALGLTLFDSLLVILIFTYFISVTKEQSFKKRFWEMALISFGVAGVSFLIGLLIRITLGIGNTLAF